jgi:hypothetical protein
VLQSFLDANDLTEVEQREEKIKFYSTMLWHLN